MSNDHELTKPLDSWRLQIVNWSSRAIALMFVVLIVYILNTPISENAPFAMNIVFWVVYPLGLFISLLPTVPYKIRATIFIIVLIITQAVIIPFNGYSIGVVLTALSAVILSGLLLGTFWAFGAWLITTLVMIVSGVLLANGALVSFFDVANTDPTILSNSLRFSLSYGIVGVVMAVGLSVIVNHLSQSLSETKDALGKLSYTHQEHLRTAEALRNSEAQVQHQQKLQSLGVLAGGIAHDFNNILQIISINSEVAKISMPIESRGAKALTDLDKGVKRASELINQILNFSRNERSAAKAVDPCIEVRTAVEMLRASYPSNIVIEEKIESLSGVIFAESTDLQQIVLNLGTNALHAMKAKGGRLEISLDETEYQGGKSARLKLKDSGYGMSDEVLEKIYDPFYTTKPVGEGTGIGMSIVHRILEDMGGHIHIESEVGIGTEVTIFMPLKEGSLDLKPDRASEARGQGEHVLIVDDESEIAQHMKVCLESLGYKVTACASSLNALSLFKSTPSDFDIVITDMMMPELPGDDLCKELRKINSSLPIILISGHLKEGQFPAISNLPEKHLVKPVTAADVSVAIQDLLNKKLG